MPSAPKKNSLDWHRVQQGTFIVAKLQFSPELSVSQDEVRNAYQDWIDEPHNKFFALAIGLLYKSIPCMGATLDNKKRTFYGIGLRITTKEGKIPSAPKKNSLDWHRVQQGTFIVAKLQFSPELSVSQDEVRNAYQDWIDGPRNKFFALAISLLYKSISCMGATLDDKKRTFYGIGLRT